MAPSHSFARLSRREFFKLAGLGIPALALLSGCTQPPALATEQQVSLDVKIGQLLMVGFRGLAVDDEHPIMHDIRERHLGSVVLFDYDVPTKSAVRNIESPAQVQTLVAALQRGAAIPLLIAIDQEGGKIRRLKEKFGFPPTVSHQYLGTINELALTHHEATIIAQMLRQAGINLNLAPVVDLNITPANPIIGKLERSFSGDPAIVTKHALEFINAHHEQGMLCSLKHFPGHGSSAADSHLGLVDVTNTWSRVELEPYRKLIGAGAVDAIMTAHVFNSKLDENNPATLSKPTINGILREELKYNGVVISDDMQMGAITKHYGFETAVQAAMESGVDILVFANNSVYEEDIVARTVALIKQLVQQGNLSEACIDTSYQRVQRLKQQLHPAMPAASMSG